MLKRLWTFICVFFRIEKKQQEVQKPTLRVMDFVKPMYGTAREMVGAEPLTPAHVPKNVISMQPRKKRISMQEECPVDLNKAFIQSIEQQERPSTRRRRQEYEEWKNGISTYDTLRKIITS